MTPSTPLTPLTLEALAERVARTSGLPEAKALSALQGLFAVAAERVAATGRAELPGIGIIVGRTDSAGAAEVSFVPAPEFAEAVNEPFAMFEPIELADDADLAIATARDGATEEQAEEATAEVKQTAAEQTVVEEPVVKEAVVKEPVVKEPAALQTAVNQPVVEQCEMPNEGGAEASSADAPRCIPTSLETGGAAVAHPRVYRLGWLAVGLVIGIIIGYLAGALVYRPAATTPQPETEQLAVSETDSIITAEPAADAVTASAADEAAMTPAAAEPAIMRTDTVTVRRYITHMAKEYYGDRTFWVYIYEANADVLGHPERTLPGTVVKIPTPESIPADPKNPADVKRARTLAAEIYGRFQ
ncbi:MAG: hypothetical protein NC187_00840 [Candidatus Amulumruptor caecigallinarius]|nr:hypothetical protein [Candidatus Amulumruptor caecigallinarius]MCM1396022.1 hypothetical protein [Candidatus Amulumruptor caecigallinarius]MCM1453021.1 hypothetical protein [bacterium]